MLPLLMQAALLFNYMWTNWFTSPFRVGLRRSQLAFGKVRPNRKGQRGFFLSGLSWKGQCFFPILHLHERSIFQLLSLVNKKPQCLLPHSGRESFMIGFKAIILISECYNLNMVVGTNLVKHFSTCLILNIFVISSLISIAISYMLMLHRSQWDSSTCAVLNRGLQNQ